MRGGNVSLFIFLIRAITQIFMLCNVPIKESLQVPRPPSRKGILGLHVAIHQVEDIEATPPFGTGHEVGLTVDFAQGLGGSHDSLKGRLGRSAGNRDRNVAILTCQLRRNKKTTHATGRVTRRRRDILVAIHLHKQAT